MKLLTKFNLLFLAVFALGIAVAGFFSHRFLLCNAREQVLEQARLMMESSFAMRDYTSQQIKPLFATEQLHKRTFLPQTARCQQII